MEDKERKFKLKYQTQIQLVLTRCLSSGGHQRFSCNYHGPKGDSPHWIKLVCPSSALALKGNFPHYPFI